MVDVNNRIIEKAIEYFEKVNINEALNKDDLEVFINYTKMNNFIKNNEIIEAIWDYLKSKEQENSNDKSQQLELVSSNTLIDNLEDIITILLDNNTEDKNSKIERNTTLKDNNDNNNNNNNNNSDELNFYLNKYKNTINKEDKDNEFDNQEDANYEESFKDINLKDEENNTITFNNSLTKNNIILFVNLKHYIQIKKLFNLLEIKTKKNVELKEIKSIIDEYTNILSISFVLTCKIILFMIDNSDEIIDSYMYSTISVNEFVKKNGSITINYNNYIRFIASLEEELLLKENENEYINSELKKTVIPSTFESLISEIDILEVQSKEYTYVISSKVRKIVERILFFNESVTEINSKNNSEKEIINKIKGKLFCIYILFNIVFVIYYISLLLNRLN